MADRAEQRLEVLAALIEIVAARRGASSETSYTAKLISQGLEKCAKKFGEEAVETVLAAVSGDRLHLMRETADLLYHLAVLLEAAHVSWPEVMAELERRSGTGGLTEKAARKGM
jgi:phosphoribosyl-ATP pyrophosphohydrolase